MKTIKKIATICSLIGALYATQPVNSEPNYTIHFSSSEPSVYTKTNQDEEEQVRPVIEKPDSEKFTKDMIPKEKEDEIKNLYFDLEKSISKLHNALVATRISQKIHDSYEDYCGNNWENTTVNGVEITLIYHGNSYKKTIAPSMHYDVILGDNEDNFHRIQMFAQEVEDEITGTLMNYSVSPYIIASHKDLFLFDQWAKTYAEDELNFYKTVARRYNYFGADIGEMLDLEIQNLNNALDTVNIITKQLKGENK